MGRARDHVRSDCKGNGLFGIYIGGVPNVFRVHYEF